MAASKILEKSQFLYDTYTGFNVSDTHTHTVLFNEKDKMGWDEWISCNVGNSQH